VVKIHAKGLKEMLYSITEARTIRRTVQFDTTQRIILTYLS